MQAQVSMAALEARSLGEAVRRADGREGCVALLSKLGFKTSVVPYEPEELDIPQYLTRDIASWCLVSHYSGGRLPFQIHLVQLTALTWWHVSSLLESFSRRHPGRYLFIMTRDYRHLALATVELSLERRPPPGTGSWPLRRRQPGSGRWPFLPKPYTRLLLVDRVNPSAWYLDRMRRLCLEPGLGEPQAIYDQVLAALTVEQQPEPFPPWFFPRTEVESRAASARGHIEECLDGGMVSVRQIRLAAQQLDVILRRPEYAASVPWWKRDHLLRARSLLDDALEPGTRKDERHDLLEEAVAELEFTGT